MKILLVTEKYNPEEIQRDGGARLVATLEKSFPGALTIMQFSRTKPDIESPLHFLYPVNLSNRFEHRIINAPFIAEQVNKVAHLFTHIIFVHISMQFGFAQHALRKEIDSWTFPMFLTPSYQLSGEIVPPQYTELEKTILHSTNNILTPSYFEKQQLLEYYNIPESKIHLIPRGVDIRLFLPIERAYTPKKTLNLCSIGSIKPQKNTLELIELFAHIKTHYPSASLRVIGPIQNEQYYARVIERIKTLKLESEVTILGYVAPQELHQTIADCHIHISTSSCETFGRSIFETLASGIPNIARIQNNAAYDFLQGLPYIKFVFDNDTALQSLNDLLRDFSHLSNLAKEVGYLYDDARLSRLLAAKIAQKDVIVVSDYDGTLFHKDNNKTAQYLKKFKQFPTKVICSARSTDDLLEQLRLYDLEVDWIIAYSGAVITDGQGNILFISYLSQKEIKKIIKLSPKYEKIIVDNKIIQLCTTIKLNINGLNIETYQDKSFYSTWQASKLRAICKLLDHINWQGNVIALGDGKYDMEYLRYFDGHLISSHEEITPSYIKSNKWVE